MNQEVIQLGGADRVKLIKRGRRLEYITIGYNSLDGLIAIAAGLIAGSIALVGFGFDSIIEITSGAVLLWRLHADVMGTVCHNIYRIFLSVVYALRAALQFRSLMRQV